MSNANLSISEEQLAKLNAEQCRVVGELDKNLLLVASAGTGKTNTLAYRVANIIASGKAKPEEILCLTFTNKACNEMRQRIDKIVGDASRQVMVKTVHGFCYEVIRNETRHSGIIDIPMDFTVFDEADCREFIKEISICNRWNEETNQKLIGLIKEYRGEYGYLSADSHEDYRRTIDRLWLEKTQRVADAARIRGYINGSWVDESNDIAMAEYAMHGADILCWYDRLLKENHGVDYNDLILNAELLLKDEGVCKRWRGYFKYLNIDEAQDTSRLEYRMLERLFTGNNILLCGDYFQTIYQWRGSEPSLIFNNYKKHFQPLQVVFYENYRATRTLINASFDYLKKAFPERLDQYYDKSTQAVTKDEGEKIVLRPMTTKQAEAAFIYTSLEKLVEQGKLQDISRACILTRSNFYNTKLSQCLAALRDNAARNGRQPLDFILVDEFKFFRRQEIKDVLAFLKLLINPQDNMSLARIIKRFVSGVGEKRIQAIQSDENLALGIRLTDFLHKSVLRYAEPFELLLRNLEKNNVVVFDVESTGLSTSSDEIVQIAAIRIDRDGKTINKFMKYLKATKSVGRSEQVHHISDAKLAAEGEAPAKVLSEFCAFAKGAVIVGHNVNYDLSILASQLSRLGLPQLEMESFYDTLDIFRRFYPNLTSHTLESMGNLCQVKHKSSHDAFDDICATAEILIYAVNNEILPTVDDRRASIGRFARQFVQLARDMEELRARIYTDRPKTLIRDIITKLGVLNYYRDHMKAGDRVENLRELIRYARELDKQNDRLSPLDALQSLLEITALSNTELDLLLQEHPRVPIITVHQAKGSEFDYVFMAGLSDGTFPSKFSMVNNDFDEDARLFYVAMTRAKKKLYLSHEENRNAHQSRFIRNIPSKYINSY